MDKKDIWNWSVKPETIFRLVLDSRQIIKAEFKLEEIFSTLETTFLASVSLLSEGIF